jgi:iron(III) transport system ATP-binding protein
MARVSGSPDLRQAPAPETPAVRADGVVVSYGTVAVVRGLDLIVRPGEVLALLGPSGSGKTTLLYALAGFLGLSGGRIELAGAVVSSPDHLVPPERRPVAMVFQHYGLWPHMSALDTVAYPMRRAGIGADEARRQAQVLLDQQRIGHLASRRPSQLSGGEQQRVGLARALARRPAVYLLDEPTAHLDGALKAELQSELATRLHADGAAAVHATHEVEEALAIADRVALLREGRVVQDGPPEAVYAAPVDAWAAVLTGPASFVDATALRSAMRGDPAEGLPSHLVGEGSGDGSAADLLEGPAGRFMLRPEWLSFDGPLPGRVVEVRYRGSHTDHVIDTAAGQLLLRAPGTPRRATGAGVTCRIERAWRMPAAR